VSLTFLVMLLLVIIPAAASSLSNGFVDVIEATATP
jgi:hypothetical protein